MSAAGGTQLSPLHSRAALRSATLRSIPFIVSPQPRLPPQECFLHSIALRKPAVSFRSPLTFQPTTRNSKPKREATFHPPPFAALHSVTTLAFPNPINGMSCEVFTPRDHKPQKPHRPLMVQVKIEDNSRMAIVACSRFVSLIQPFALTLVPRVAAH